MGKYNYKTVQWNPKHALKSSHDVAKRSLPPSSHQSSDGWKPCQHTTGCASDCNAVSSLRRCSNKSNYTRQIDWFRFSQRIFKVCSMLWSGIGPNNSSNSLKPAAIYNTKMTISIEQIVATHCLCLYVKLFDPTHRRTNFLEKKGFVEIETGTAIPFVQPANL